MLASARCSCLTAGDMGISGRIRASDHTFAAWTGNATPANAAARTRIVIIYGVSEFLGCGEELGRPLETGDALCRETILALGVGAYEVSCRARATKCSRCRSTVRPDLLSQKYWVPR
jgi:hypothetical protein